MVCRNAWLMYEPTVAQERPRETMTYNEKGWKWAKLGRMVEPPLVPYWYVSCSVDYGFCCGVDNHTKKFATQEAAEAYKASILAGEVDWIDVDEERMKDYAEEAAEWEAEARRIALAKAEKEKSADQAPVAG